MSPAELQPVERLPEIFQISLNLSLTERVVGDGIQITADPGRGSDGGANGLMGGWHGNDEQRGGDGGDGKVVE